MDKEVIKRIAEALETLTTTGIDKVGICTDEYDINAYKVVKVIRIDVKVK